MITSVFCSIITGMIPSRTVQAGMKNFIKSYAIFSNIYTSQPLKTLQKSTSLKSVHISITGLTMVKPYYSKGDLLLNPLISICLFQQRVLSNCWLSLCCKTFKVEFNFTEAFF